MKFSILYGCFLLVGLPLIMFIVHIATLPNDAKRDLTDSAKDFNGRIYTARIDCKRGRGDHFVRVHGRNRDDARRKIQGQVRRCDVELIKTASDSVWQKTLRSAY
jgi:hypothetical protein